MRSDLCDSKVTTQLTWLLLKYSPQVMATALPAINRVAWGVVLELEAIGEYLEVVKVRVEETRVAKTIDEITPVFTVVVNTGLGKVEPAIPITGGWLKDDNGIGMSIAHVVAMVQKELVAFAREKGAHVDRPAALLTQSIRERSKK